MCGLTDAKLEGLITELSSFQTPHNPDLSSASEKRLRGKDFYTLEIKGKRH